MATKTTDLSALRQALGIGPEVPDSDLRDLLKSATGQKELKHIESQPKGQPAPGLLGQVGQFFSNFPDAAGRVGTDIDEEALRLLAGHLIPRTDTPAPKKKADKAKPLPDPASAAASVPESPYQELAQALASEYLNQVQQLMPLTSGSGIFGPSGATNQVVNEAANMIPGGGAWLQQQAAAEQKAAAPLQAAMNQVGEAQAQGALPYAGAIANTGTANTQFLEAAPWQQILQELASETAYKAASTQGSAAFGLTPQNTPAFLNQILQSHGLTGTAALGGLQPVGTAAKGGKKSSVPGATTSPNG